MADNITKRIQLIIDIAQTSKDLDTVKNSILQLNNIISQIGDQGSAEFILISNAINSLGEKLLTLQDSLNIPLVTDAPEVLDSISQELDSIESKEVNLEVTVNDESIPELKSELDSISVDPVNVDVTVNDQPIEELKTELDSLENQTVNIDVEISKEGIQDLKTELEGIQDETISVDVVSNSESIDSIKEELNSLEDQSISVQIDADTTQVDQLKTDLDSLESQTVNVDVETNSESIPELKAEIDSLSVDPINIDIKSDPKQIQDVKKGLDSIPATKVTKLDVKTDKKVIDDLLKNTGNINKQLDLLDKKDPNIKITDNVDDVSDKLDEVPKKIDEIKDSLQQRIELAIDASKSISSVQEFKKNQRELRSLLLEVGDEGSAEFEKLAVAIGASNDRVDDINDKIKSLSNAPIENLSGGFKDVKNSILDLNFSDFNKQVSALSITAKQVSFKDLSKSIGETGKSFLTLGELITKNPIGILATVIGLIIANFDKLKETFGPLLIQLRLIGAATEFVTDIFKGLGDAIGLTSFAEDEAAEKSKKANQKRIEAISELLSNTEKYYAAVNGLNEEDIKNIQDKFNLVELNAARETNIFEARLVILDEERERISGLGSDYAKLLQKREELQSKGKDLDEEELKQLIELEAAVKENLDKRVQVYADRAKKIADIEKQSAQNIENLQINQIANTEARSVAQSNLDEKRALESIESRRKEAESLLKISKDNENATAQDREDFAKKSADLAKQFETEITLTQQQFANQRVQIAKDEAERRSTESQKFYENELKQLNDANQIAINETEEGSAERLAAEKKSIDDRIAFLNTNYKRLGLNEKELTLLLQDETKKRTEILDNYANKIVDIQNRIKTIKIEIEIATAGNPQEILDAQIKQIEENARQQIEVARRTIKDKELLAKEEELITLNKNNAIENLNNNFADRERQAAAESAQFAANQAAREINDINKSYSDRKEILEKSYQDQRDQRKANMDEELANTNLTEQEKDNIRSRYREAEIAAEEDKIETIKNLNKSQAEELRAKVDLISSALVRLGDSMGGGFSAAGKAIATLADMSVTLQNTLRDIAASGGSVQATFQAVAEFALSSIGQIGEVLAAFNQEKIDKINAETDAQLEANETETNSKLDSLQSQLQAGIITETQYTTAVDAIKKSSAVKEEQIKEAGAKKELAAKKKAFNQNKAIQIINAVIATAQGVVAAFQLGPITGAIMAAVIGALGVAQIATIASQKFPESGSAGGGGGASANIPDISSSLPSDALSPSFQAPEFFGIGQQGQNQPQPIVIQNNISESEITSVQTNVNNIETRAIVV